MAKSVISSLTFKPQTSSVQSLKPVGVTQFDFAVGMVLVVVVVVQQDHRGLLGQLVRQVLLDLRVRQDQRDLRVFQDRWDCLEQLAQMEIPDSRDPRVTKVIRAIPVPMGLTVSMGLRVLLV
jgi:hypothetical protein